MPNKPKLISTNEGLVVKNLRKSIARKPIVRNVSLKLERGSVVGLLGANGAGKTSTFLNILGILNPDGGEITLDNQDITNLPMYKRCRRGIGFLPQQRSLFRGLSVEDNILAILEMKKEYSSAQRQSISEELLAEFNLSHLRKAKSNTLSGGECRKVEFCRAVASSPSYILLDEPFSACDPLTIEDIKKLIKKLSSKNIGILITDHSAASILDIANYSYIVNHGEVVAEGSSDELIDNKIARKAYFGENFRY